MQIQVQQTMHILGGIPKMLVFWNFLKIVMVSDKMIQNLKIHKTINKPITKICIFTIYQKLYIGFNPNRNPTLNQKNK